MMDDSDDDMTNLAELRTNNLESTVEALKKSQLFSLDFRTHISVRKPTQNETPQDGKFMVDGFNSYLKLETKRLQEEVNDF